MVPSPVTCTALTRRDSPSRAGVPIDEAHYKLVVDGPEEIVHWTDLPELLPGDTGYANQAALKIVIEKNIAEAKAAEAARASSQVDATASVHDRSSSLIDPPPVLPPWHAMFQGCDFTADQALDEIKIQGHTIGFMDAAQSQKFAIWLLQHIHESSPLLREHEVVLRASTLDSPRRTDVLIGALRNCPVSIAVDNQQLFGEIAAI